MDYLERWKQAAARDDDAEKLSIIRTADEGGCLSEDAPAMRMLLTAIEDPRETVQTNALFALARVAPKTQSAVSAVVEWVDSSLYPINMWALTTFLASAGPAATPALPHLLRILRQLNEERPMIKAYWDNTLRAIGSIGPAARDAIPLLIDSLEAGTDDNAIYGAVDALVLIGRPSLRPMMEYASRPQANQYAHGVVIQALSRFSDDADVTIPFLIQLLKSNHRLEWAIVDALGAFGPRAGVAIPHLLARLPSADSWVTDGLWRIQRDPATILPQLISTLQSDDVSSSTIRILGEIGPPATSAIPSLRKLLFCDDESRRQQAAVALWRIEKCDEGLLVILSGEWLLKVKAHSWNEEDLLQCLAEIRQQSLPLPTVAATLQTFLGRRQLDRSEAAKAIAKAGPRVIPALMSILECVQIRRLNSRCKDIALRTMLILETYGESASPAVLSLTKVLSHRCEPYLKSGAIRALGRIAMGNELAASRIVSELEHESAQVRVAAATALGQIGVGEKYIQHSLVRALNDSHPRVRAEVARSLGSLPMEVSPAVVSALIDALADSSRRVKAYATTALGKLRPPAVDAVPALQQLLSNGGLKGHEQLIRRTIESISH